MKAFAVVLALCLAGAYAASSLTPEQKAKLGEYKYTCFMKSGLDPNVFESFKANIAKGVDGPADEKLNCFAACMLEKIGIMRPDGTIDEAVARTKVPQDLPMADQIINTCKTQVGKDSCETGGKVMGCLIKTKALDMLLA